MCGVLGAIVNPKAKVKIDANEKIIYQFEDQYKRGQEGFGIIRFSNGKIDGIDRACTPTKFLMDLTIHKSESIIAHHRQPTSTDNKIGQTHPIFVSNKELKYDYYVVHNGVIRNDTELKKWHEELGYKYLTEVKEERWTTGFYQREYASRIETKWNDSEAMAIDLARYIENHQKELKIEGSAAFIALQIKKNTNEIQKTFFGRRLNPIKIEEEKGYVFLSSEGKGKEIDARELFSINIAKPKFIKGKYKIHKRKMLYEDERLEKEKKIKEDKEEKDEKKKRNEERGIENMGVDQLNPLNLPFKQELVQLKPEEQARKLLDESKEGKEEKEFEKAYHSELKDSREYFEGQLYTIEQSYGENAKKGIERNLGTIESDIFDAFDSLKDLVGEILSAYTDIMIEPGFSTADEKPRRTMTMQMISKVINSLENIGNYESSIIEQKISDKDDEDMEIKHWNESFGITAKGQKALKDYRTKDNHQEEYTGYTHYPGRMYGSEYLD